MGQTRNGWIGTSVGWGLGVFFALAGLGALTDSSVVSAVIFFLLALFLLPPINRLIEEQANWRPAVWLTITIVAVGFCAAMILAPVKLNLMPAAAPGTPVMNDTPLVKSEVVAPSPPLPIAPAAQLAQSTCDIDSLTIGAVALQVEQLPKQYQAKNSWGDLRYNTTPAFFELCGVGVIIPGRISVLDELGQQQLIQKLKNLDREMGDSATPALVTSCPASRAVNVSTLRINSGPREEYQYQVLQFNTTERASSYFAQLQQDAKTNTNIQQNGERYGDQAVEYYINQKHSEFGAVFWDRPYVIYILKGRFVAEVETWSKDPVANKDVAIATAKALNKNLCGT